MSLDLGPVPVSDAAYLRAAVAEVGVDIDGDNVEE